MVRVSASTQREGTTNLTRYHGITLRQDLGARFESRAASSAGLRGFVETGCKGGAVSRANAFVSLALIWRRAVGCWRRWPGWSASVRAKKVYFATARLLAGLGSSRTAMMEFVIAKRALPSMCCVGRQLTIVRYQEEMMRWRLFCLASTSGLLKRPGCGRSRSQG